MSTSRRAAIRSEADRFLNYFLTAGAELVEANILQRADTLLDLYGEDIRGRAFVTQDPALGEMMMRPDFTVPVVQMHMSEGAAPARYTYSGPVFRRQPPGSNRPSEYLQVGYEIFDQADPLSTDAEAFHLFSSVLAPFGLTAVTGDMGLLRRAVEGLQTTDRRKTALLRHLWRPTRFSRLMDRFSNAEVLSARGNAAEMAKSQSEASQKIGLRRAEEMADRFDALEADAKAAPISSEEVAALDEIFAINLPMPAAITRLEDLSQVIPGISEAITNLKGRGDALVSRGLDVQSLSFDASFGRTSLEYYDGFVFGFSAPNRPDLPMIASKLND